VTVPPMGLAVVLLSMGSCHLCVELWCISSMKQAATAHTTQDSVHCMMMPAELPQLVFKAYS